MNEELLLSSLKNPRLRSVLALSEAKKRRQTGRFALEGAREISRALRLGYKLCEVYVCAEALSPEAEAVLATLPQSLRRYKVTAPVFAKLAVREGSDGLVAVLEQQQRSLIDLQLPPKPLLLAVQNLEKPGNLGALLRSADGAGVDAVVCLDRALDLYHPHLLRTSLGTAFALPVVAASSAVFKQFCLERGLAVYAAALTSSTRPYTAVDYREAAVILLGEEAQGLSADWLSAATACIKIPMHGVADSLNVAAAGAVLLYEARRQRTS